MSFLPPGEPARVADFAASGVDFCTKTPPVRDGFRLLWLTGCAANGTRHKMAITAARLGSAIKSAKR